MACAVIKFHLIFIVIGCHRLGCMGSWFWNRIQPGGGLLGSVLEINTFSGKEKEVALEREKLSCHAVSMEVLANLKKAKTGWSFRVAPHWLRGQGLYTQHGPVIGCGVLWEGVWLWMMASSWLKKYPSGPAALQVAGESALLLWRGIWMLHHSSHKRGR